MLGLRKGPSAHVTAIAMVAARPGDEAVVVGADAAGLAAELARVTGLNGCTRVIDVDADARAAVERAAANAGSLVEFEAMTADRWPLDDASELRLGLSPSPKRPAHRPHLFERTAVAGAVGKQHEVAIARRIDPERRTREPDVAEGPGRHPRAA